MNPSSTPPKKGSAPGPVPRAANRIRLELGLGDRFTVAYSGNFGLAHPLEALVDAATTLVRRGAAVDHVITAPADGVVKDVHFAAGEQVPEGAELITLE